MFCETYGFHKDLHRKQAKNINFCQECEPKFAKSWFRFKLAFFLIIFLVLLLIILLATLIKPNCGENEVYLNKECVPARNSIWPDLESINECDIEMINGEEIVQGDIDGKYYFEKLSDFSNC